MTNRKTKNLNVRMEEPLYDEVGKVAEKLPSKDKSNAARFLINLGLMVLNRSADDEGYKMITIALYKTAGLIPPDEKDINPVCPT